MLINMLMNKHHGHLKKNNFERMEVVLFTLVETIRQISILLQPFIPDTLKKY